MVVLLMVGLERQGGKEVNESVVFL